MAAAAGRAAAHFASHALRHAPRRLAAGAARQLPPRALPVLPLHIHLSGHESGVMEGNATRSAARGAQARARNVCATSPRPTIVVLAATRLASIRFASATAPPGARGCQLVIVAGRTGPTRVTHRALGARSGGRLLRRGAASSARPAIRSGQGQPHAIVAPRAAGGCVPRRHGAPVGS